MRIPGYISPSKTARMLDVHINTVRTWCQKAIAGEPSKLVDVVQHLTGYYWINHAEVKVLRRRIRRAKAQ
jgi:hypothetical protein